MKVKSERRRKIRITERKRRVLGRCNGGNRRRREKEVEDKLMKNSGGQRVKKDEK